MGVNDDTIYASTGDDLFDGGTGINGDDFAGSTDVLTFELYATGVAFTLATANLMPSSGTGFTLSHSELGAASTTTFTDFEELKLTTGDDALSLGAGILSLDTLVIDALDGKDVLDASMLESGVTISFGDGPFEDRQVITIINELPTNLAGFENAVGTAFDDFFTDDPTAHNRFIGGGGIDTFHITGNGTTGPDVVWGGAEADIYNISTTRLNSTEAPHLQDHTPRVLILHADLLTYQDVLEMDVEAIFAPVEDVENESWDYKTSYAWTEYDLVIINPEAEDEIWIDGVQVQLAPKVFTQQNTPYLIENTNPSDVTTGQYVEWSAYDQYVMRPYIAAGWTDCFGYPEHFGFGVPAEDSSGDFGWVDGAWSIEYWNYGELSLAPTANTVDWPENFVNGDTEFRSPTLFTGTATETAGTSGAETMAAASHDEQIDMGGGDDILNLNGYRAVVLAGLGRDQVSALDAITSVEISLEEGFARGGGMHYTELSGFEDAKGGTGDDTITGDDLDNTLAGRTGNDALHGLSGTDILYGGGGADILDGGDDFDWAYYVNSSAAITVNLETGAASGGEAAGDTFISIERVDGSGYDDNITGDGTDNWLRGRAGTDTLTGGSGNDTLEGGEGADALIGGSGTDWARYVESTSGVNVSLVSNTGTGGEAQGDTLSGIERLDGSDHADTLTGASGVNWLRGRGGADVIKGGTGNDVLFGGTEADVFKFAATDGHDEIRDWEDGLDMIDLASTALAFASLNITATAAGHALVSIAAAHDILIWNAAGVIGTDDFLFA